MKEKSVFHHSYIHVIYRIWKRIILNSHTWLFLKESDSVIALNWWVHARISPIIHMKTLKISQNLDHFGRGEKKKRVPVDYRKFFNVLVVNQYKFWDIWWTRNHKNCLNSFYWNFICIYYLYVLTPRFGRAKIYEPFRLACCGDSNGQRIGTCSKNNNINFSPISNI